MAPKGESNETETDEAPSTKRATRFQLWFEEAWEGWLKSVGLMLVCVLAYVLYKFDLVGEPLAGLVAVLVVVLGAVASTVPTAWSQLESRGPALRAVFATFVAVWIGATGYPSLRAALPPTPLAQGKLSADKPSVKLKAASTGPYELEVSGQFKVAGMSEAEVGYVIKAEGGGATDDVSGSLKRSLMRVRTSRRGGTSTSVTEQTEISHRLPSVRGGEVTLTADSVDDQLADGLQVYLRSAGPNPLLFMILGVLAALVALFFDVKLYDPKSKGKEKTYLGAAVGVALAFSIAFPIESTPHSLVRPAVSSMMLALFVGGLGGWLLSVIARALFVPKPAKKAKKS